METFVHGIRQISQGLFRANMNIASVRIFKKTFVEILHQLRGPDILRQ